MKKASENWSQHANARGVFSLVASLIMIIIIIIMIIIICSFIVRFLTD